MNTAFFITCLLLTNLSEPVSTSSEKTTDTKIERLVPGQTPAKSKGYWVIQQTTGISDRVLVLYYNERNELVKKEWRSAKEADSTRGKVIRSLKRSLHEVLKLQRDEDLY